MTAWSATLQVIYRDKTLPIDLRLDAAKSAVRFEKPQLSSVDQTKAAVEAAPAEAGAAAAAAFRFTCSPK